MLGGGAYDHIAEGCRSPVILQRSFLRRVLILSGTQPNFQTGSNRKVEQWWPQCWIGMLS